MLCVCSRHQWRSDASFSCDSTATGASLSYKSPPIDVAVSCDQHDNYCIIATGRPFCSAQADFNDDDATKVSYRTHRHHSKIVITGFRPTVGRQCCELLTVVGVLHKRDISGVFCVGTSVQATEVVVRSTRLELGI